MLENQLIAAQRRLATLRAASCAPNAPKVMLSPVPNRVLVPMPPELLEFEITKGSVPNIYGGAKSGSFPKR